MGKITIRETSQVGESFSGLEYIFEDSSDYFAWSEQKTEALNKAIKNFSDSLLDTQDEVENNVTEIKVGKKAKEPTKH